jgi:hypothetical protein
MSTMKVRSYITISLPPVKNGKYQKKEGGEDGIDPPS